MVAPVLSVWREIQRQAIPGRLGWKRANIPRAANGVPTDLKTATTSVNQGCAAGCYWLQRLQIILFSYFLVLEEVCDDTNRSNKAYRRLGAVTVQMDKLRWEGGLDALELVTIMLV